MKFKFQTRGEIFAIARYRKNGTGIFASICATIMHGRKCLSNWEGDSGQIREGAHPAQQSPRYFNAASLNGRFPDPPSECSVVVGQQKHAKKGEAGAAAAGEIDTNTTAAAEAGAHLTIVHKPAPNCFFALLGPQQPAAAAEVRLVSGGMFF